MSSKLIAVVAGVGPGTGAAVARRFAKSYPVVLLARKPESYVDIEKEINDAGGKAIGVATDITDEESIKKAWETITKEFGADVGVAVCDLASGEKSTNW
jgi:NADP-dependent 3-hydroxy acid dehydrogenase YdfG